MQNDQLCLERKIRGTARYYNEGHIHFAPTFKYKVGKSEYKDKRQCSWTDRIIFRSNGRLLKLVNYDSNNLVTCSDHRPVFA